MDKFDIFATYLRKTLPTKKKTIIKRVKMKDHGRTTVSDRGTITVTIDKTESISEQMETLIHEWGHVLEFDRWRVHGPQWAKYYAIAYEAWENFK